MKLTHINCKNPDCQVCFNDAEKLEKELTNRTGIDTVDHLGKYHLWLSKHGINPETEWGWFTIDAFDDENIEAYVKEIKQ